jgi:FPC/CPF motif-containing protein YcgG
LKCHPPSGAVIEQIEKELRSFVADSRFPCVGAKAALRRDQLEVLVVGDIRDPSRDRDITNVLQRFAEEHGDAKKVFVSQAVVFTNRGWLSELEFETQLWQRLSAIHRMDAEHYLWDPKVDSDPGSPHFSLSVGGCGFFVVGLHPGSSRKARRFRYPAMIFNLHAQFERLRAEGRYSTIRDKIIERDILLSGSANPMLAVHGEGSAAAQYSGRKVGRGWKCPFRHV